MAVLVTPVLPRQLYLLTVSGQAGQLELLRWTQATGAVTAGAGVALPADFVAHLNKRYGTLINAVAGADQLGQVALLASLCTVREGSGDLQATVNAQNAGAHLLELGFCDAAKIYYVFLSVPHSMVSPLC